MNYILTAVRITDTSRRTVTVRIATAFFIEHGKSNIKDRTVEFAVSFFGNKVRKLQFPLTLCNDCLVFSLAKGYIDRALAHTSQSRTWLPAPLYQENRTYIV